MKRFLADESVDFRIIKSLRGKYDVQAVIEIHAGITDEEVLQLANHMEALLLTEDKDFGELTFRLKKPHNGILLIRMNSVPISTKVEILNKVFDTYLPELYGKFTVLTEDKIRIKEMQK